MTDHVREGIFRVGLWMVESWKGPQLNFLVLVERFKMKYLYVMRHGDAEVCNFDLDDFDRGLSESGSKKVREVAERFAQEAESIELLVSSTAKRAFDTAKLWVLHSGMVAQAIRTDSKIYRAKSADLLKLIASIDEGVDTLMLIGHNPGITDLVSDLVGGRTISIPTSGVVRLLLPVANWFEVEFEKALTVSMDSI
jgi:phosphohistidine phosphatase